MNILKAILFLCSMPFLLEAQYVHSSIGVSRTLAIHPDFPSITKNAISANLSVVFNTKNSKSVWAQVYKYPELYLSLDYQSAGTSILGNVIGIAPLVGIPISNSEKESVTLLTGLGLGIATNPFDKISNPTNIVIGSTLSIYAKVSLQYKRKVTDQLYFLSNIAVHHYSNGNFVSPNIGANLLETGVGLGIQFLNNESIKQPSVLETDFPFQKSVWKPFIRIGVGLKEQAIDGPKFPVYILGGGIHKRTSRKDIFLIGAEYMVNYADIHFLKSTFDFEGEEKKKASRILLFGGHEFIFKRFSFHTEIGYYFTDHYDKRSTISSKIGFSVHLNRASSFGNIQTGLYVRAKMLEAEFLEWNVNFSF